MRSILRRPLDGDQVRGQQRRHALLLRGGLLDEHLHPSSAQDCNGERGQMAHRASPLPGTCYGECSPQRVEVRFAMASAGRAQGPRPRMQAAIPGVGVEERIVVHRKECFLSVGMKEMRPILPDDIGTLRREVFQEGFRVDTLKGRARGITDCRWSCSERRVAAVAAVGRVAEHIGRGRAERVPAVGQCIPCGECFALPSDLIQPPLMGSEDDVARQPGKEQEYGTPSHTCHSRGSRWVTGRIGPTTTVGNCSDMARIPRKSASTFSAEMTRASPRRKMRVSGGFRGLAVS